MLTLEKPSQGLKDQHKISDEVQQVINQLNNYHNDDDDVEELDKSKDHSLDEDLDKQETTAS